MNLIDNLPNLLNFDVSPPIARIGSGTHNVVMQVYDYSIG